MSQKGWSRQKRVQRRNERRAAKMDLRNSELDQISTLSEDLIKTSNELRVTKDSLDTLRAMYDADTNFLHRVIANKRRSFQRGIAVGFVSGLCAAGSALWLVLR